MALEGQTFFKLNSSKLIPSAQARLKQIATEIRRNGYKGSIRITGNTCGLGNAAYDQRLSEQRARAVRAFLIKNGFNAANLVARGLGKGHPK
jgi:outer membrane protein OmpA-like peptidoglycan-associated protein